MSIPWTAPVGRRETPKGVIGEARARLFRLDESQAFPRRRVHGVENTIRDPGRCGRPHQQNGVSLVRKDGITIAPSAGTESNPPILQRDPNRNVIRLIRQLVGQPGICCLRN